MTRMPINRKHKRQYTQSGEAGFTMIEMIIVIVLASVLGIFVFQILTKSLGAQVAMQTRKERDDDAILVLEKISREVKQANSIDTAINDELIFIRADTGNAVKFVRNTGTNRLRRQSAPTVPALPGNSTSGDIVAENVSAFNCSSEAGSGSIDRIVIDLRFSEGSDWKTKIYPRNFGL